MTEDVGEIWNSEGKIEVFNGGFETAWQKAEETKNNKYDRSAEEVLIAIDEVTGD